MIRNNNYFNKRPRGRGNNNRRPARNTTIESNGPEVKLRGNPHQLAEKYQSLARDAGSTGDRVISESLYQHAEHYQRLVNMQQSATAPSNGHNEEKSARPADAPPWEDRKNQKADSSPDDVAPSQD